MRSSEKINVLFFCHYYQSFTGGPRATANLIQSLDRERFQVLFISQKDSEMTSYLTEKGFTVKVLPLPDLLDVQNEQVFTYGLIKKIYSVKSIFSYNKKIFQTCKENDIQVVWGRNVKSILLIGSAGFFASIPVIWDVGMEKESKGLMKLIHFIGLCLSRKVVTEAYCQPKLIFSGFLYNLFKAKFSPIYPGIDPDRAGKLQLINRVIHPKNDPFKVLIIGSIQARKNQLLSLNVLASLLEEYPNLSLTIVGPVIEEDYWQICQKYIENEGLDKNVNYIGWSDNIFGLMESHNLFLLTSNNEGIPYVIHEAMHAALPIVSTNAGGVPEAIIHQKSGIVCETNDLEALSSGVKHCIEHRQEALEMGHKARIRAQEFFSRKVWSEKYSDLLLDVANK